MEAMNLRSSAAPSAKFTDGKQELTLVCRKIPGMGVRLTWLEEKRVLELLFTFVAIALNREVDVGDPES